MSPDEAPPSLPPVVFRTRTRVRYGETDQMGIVYHANYLVYFEIGRTDLIRQYGITYAEMEARGVRLPVVSAELRFATPARYDEEIEIETRLLRSTGVRLEFGYTVRRNDGTHLAEGSTVLASVDLEGRPKRLPVDLREQLSAGLS